MLVQSMKKVLRSMFYGISSPSDVNFMRSNDVITNVSFPFNRTTFLWALRQFVASRCTPFIFRQPFGFLIYAINRIIQMSLTHDRHIVPKFQRHQSIQRAILRKMVFVKYKYLMF